MGGKLFTGESAKRATQIVKALYGLTIREAQDLLERVNIYLLTLYLPQIDENSLSRSHLLVLKYRGVFLLLSIHSYG